MNEHHDDNLRLARAIRFAVACILLVLSYFSVRGSLLIFDFRRIFADLLEGTKLPFVTTVVFGGDWVFVALSVILPVVALVTLFDRAIVRSFYVLGVLALITLAEIMLLYQALCAPLFSLLDELGSTSAR